MKFSFVFINKIFVYLFFFNSYYIYQGIRQYIISSMMKF